MNHTANYNLNQWEKDDRIQMEDFNADNAKIDGAIKAVDQKVDARADALAASKADISALNALAQVVSQKGNCEIVAGSYVGTGEYGPDHPCKLTFSHRPMLVILSDISSHNEASVVPIMMPGVVEFRTGSRAWGNRLTMDDRSVSWYYPYGSASAEAQANTKDRTYYYIALLML